MNAFFFIDLYSLDVIISSDRQRLNVSTEYKENTGYRITSSESSLCGVKLKFRSVPVVINTAADIGIDRFNPLSNLVIEVKEL